MPNSASKTSTPRDIDDIETAYQRWAPIYDAIYGVLLQPGRRRAMAALRPRPGESILEVGVGTGVGLAHYPPGCRVTAIDLSAPMMARAASRRRDQRLDGISLCRMDAQQLAFGDGVFDAIYAPYLINVVPDPVAAAREMVRVCRRGGRLVFLNHFAGTPGSFGLANRIVGHVAAWLTGVDWHLDLQAFLVAAGLRLESFESVNVPRVSSLVVVRAADAPAPREPRHDPVYRDAVLPSERALEVPSVD